jgi:hypothetical protein
MIILCHTPFGIQPASSSEYQIPNYYRPFHAQEFRVTYMEIWFIISRQYMLFCDGDRDGVRDGVGVGVTAASNWWGPSDTKMNF